MQSALRPNDAKSSRRSANLRTALILASIAAVFFGGIIAAQLTGGNAVGIGVLGFAIIGLLLVTVSRKLRGDTAKMSGKTGPK
ncbi:MAG TPA: cytochrome oxidase small assembly protein [Casimicrobiaceae bacterium]|nr:cytochrome oxidase small assembly protein [Casimicrobiaceae bacterium]